MTSNSESQTTRLAEAFDERLVQEVQKGFKALSYVPVSEYIVRLNSVLGGGGWSRQIQSVQRDAADPDEIIALVRIVAEVDGCTVTKDGVGGARIKKKRDSNELLDLGNDFKSAVSDAFKKACQDLGIGLYLARSEDALSLEQEDAMPVSTERWERFTALFIDLPDDKKEQFREWWAGYGDREKPYREMPANMFDAAMARISLLAGEAGTGD